MQKEKFEKGNYYTYEGTRGYAYAQNKLVLETGLLVKRTMDKYAPDTTTYGGVDKHGYLRTKVEGKMVSVHRLVAIHFIENPKNLPVVDHINENKQDNRKENLQWVTMEHNTSRIDIRENRALNQAKKLHKEAKEKEAQAKAYYEDVEAERQEIAEQYQKLEHMKEVIGEELDAKIQEYEERLNKLISIASGEVNRKEKVRAEYLRREVRSRKKMIAEVGKKIKINNSVYPSVRSAARFIVDEERRRRGKLLNTETVRKELKRVQTGARSEGVMYEVYEVARV